MHLIKTVDNQQMQYQGFYIKYIIHVPPHQRHLVGHIVCSLILMLQIAQVPKLNEKFSTTCKHKDCSAGHSLSGSAF